MQAYCFQLVESFGTRRRKELSEYGERLRAEYETLYPKYEQFTKDLSSLLERLLTDEGIEHLPIESRTKDRDSFITKVERPDKLQKYNACDDITDLTGVRVISYLQEDRDKICEMIERNFAVDAVNSVEKDALLDADQFGYRSTHYVVSYTAERASLPEFHNFQDIKAEIQVRTLLQHTWAAIDWKLRYKNTFEAPKEVRRRLYRISALLELADDEFSGLSGDIDRIRKSYQEKMLDGDLRIDIDNESIELFVKTNDVVRSIIAAAELSGYTIAPFPPSSRNPYYQLLQTLATSEVWRIEQLNDLLQKTLASDDKTLKAVFDAWNTPGKPAKLVTDFASLVRISTVLAISREKARNVLRDFPFGPELQRAIHQVVG